MLTIITSQTASSAYKNICAPAAENLKMGGESILVVPESEAVSAERRMSALCRGEDALRLEILNFDKLCEAVFRKCGSLYAHFLSDGEKKLILSRALTELKPSLKEFTSRSDDSAYLNELLAGITELKYANITPNALASAAHLIENSEENNKLAVKALELSLIFTAYNTLLSSFGDDPCDSFAECSELIRKYKPYEGKKIYFSSFFGFTGAQYDVMEALLQTGADVTVSLFLPSFAIKRSELFAPILETENKLRSIASAISCETVEISSSDTDGSISPAITHLLENFDIAGNGGTSLFGKTDDITVISASDIFDECEACAQAIAKRVHEGARYSDIGIILRDVEKYSGIIDLALERQNIPCFISKKTDITEKSLIRFILSAIKICRSGAKHADMIDYMKSGLTLLSENEADLLENYASSWRVSGKIWFSDTGFTMNPRGYLPLTSADSDLLARINSLRLILIHGLDDLRINLEKSTTVLDYLKAIYAFLDCMPISERLAERSLKFEERGEALLSHEEQALFAALSSACDNLARSLGGYECPLDEFLKLFNIALSDTEIGSIPQALDVVTVNDASLHRDVGLKYIFMLGLEEGSFPKSIGESGVFTAKERRILADNKLDELEYDPVMEASKELFYFYFSASSAEKGLYMSYSRRDGTGSELKKSSALSSCEELFENISSYSNSEDFQRIYTKEALIENLPYIRQCFGDIADTLIDDDDELVSLEKLASRQIARRDEKISKQISGMLHSGDIKLSQTLSDTYASCPFSYQCKYTLSLKERISPEISKLDTGVLVHSVLDEFMKTDLKKVRLPDGRADRDKINEKIHEITAKRALLILSFSSDEKRARIERLLERISDITALVCADLVEEFFESGFEPSFFEFPINGREGGVLPIKLKLEDGSYAMLKGVADRVDTMVKGKKLYIRVVDYKTGKRAFSLENIKLGLSLQLLIYLFTIWDNANTAFKLAVGADKDCEVIPAGAQYIMTTPDKSTLPENTARVDIAEALSRSFKRSGIYLADESILRSMDPSLSGRFLPVSTKLTPRGTSVLASLDELDLLKNEVSGILIEIANGIKNGNAEVSPLPSSPERAHSSCEFCSMKPVCKNIAEA